MTFTPAPVTLEGTHVRLEPLGPDHAVGIAAASEDRSLLDFSDCRGLGLQSVAAWIDTALQQPDEVPFAIVHREQGVVVGSTRYMEIRVHDRGLEIGSTWIGVPWQRSVVNTECKLLLLEHAFDQLGAIRVQFKTDERNVRSQRAIERIGAVREGILRKVTTLHDGFQRSSVYYSIIAEEWPTVRERLKAMVNC